MRKEIYYLSNCKIIIKYRLPLFRRGLTPPHRVKSISMATFTQDDITFLKERGNEYCRRTWLGLVPPNSSLAYADSKDEQKMKEMMSERYEMKRFYIAPSPTSKTKTESKELNSSLPRVPNFGTPQSTPSPNSTQNSKISESTNSFSMDFVADFSKVPDPYLPPTPTNYNQPIVSQPSFANFDNNPIFNSSNSTGSLNQADGYLSPNFNTISSPSEDRYAALKDLQAQLKEENSPEPSNCESAEILCMHMIDI